MANRVDAGVSCAGAVGQVHAWGVGCTYGRRDGCCKRAVVSVAKLEFWKIEKKQETPEKTPQIWSPPPTSPNVSPFGFDFAAQIILLQAAATGLGGTCHVQQPKVESVEPAEERNGVLSPPYRSFTLTQCSPYFLMRIGTMSVVILSVCPAHHRHRNGLCRGLWERGVVHSQKKE